MNLFLTFSISTVTTLCYISEFVNPALANCFKKDVYGNENDFGYQVLLEGFGNALATVPGLFGTLHYHQESQSARPSTTSTIYLNQMRLTSFFDDDETPTVGMEIRTNLDGAARFETGEYPFIYFSEEDDYTEILAKLESLKILQTSEALGLRLQILESMTSLVDLDRLNGDPNNLRNDFVNRFSDPEIRLQIITFLNSSIRNRDVLEGVRVNLFVDNIIRKMLQ